MSHDALCLGSRWGPAGDSGGVDLSAGDPCVDEVLLVPSRGSVASGTLNNPAKSESELRRKP
jgi:hypothetical protein